MAMKNHTAAILSGDIANLLFLMSAAPSPAIPAPTRYVPRDCSLLSRAIAPEIHVARHKCAHVRSHCTERRFLQIALYKKDREAEEKCRAYPECRAADSASAPERRRQHDQHKKSSEDKPRPVGQRHAEDAGDQ